MKEPEPQRMYPPEGSEPELRVGVILPEDGYSSFTFRVPCKGFTLSSGENSLPLDKDRNYTVDNKDSSLRVSGERVKHLLVTAEPIFLSCKEQQPFAAQSGVTVEGVTAGRGFHWQKKIDQTLPGKFEIHPHDGKLVLVNCLSFEQYLACVISSEMSSECPEEFMKAQAVAARSWAKVFLVNKHPDQVYDVCNDDHCQRYQGTTHLAEGVIRAIEECRGNFLVDDQGYICPGYYSKSCGGFTEDVELAYSFPVRGMQPCFDSSKDAEPEELDLRKENVFTKWLDAKTLRGAGIYCSPDVIPEQNLPKYLGAVDTSQSYFRWRHVLSGKDLCGLLKEKYNLGNLERIQGIDLGPRGHSGRILSATVRYETDKGKSKELLLEDQYEVRNAFHDSFLYSSAFTLSVMEDDQGYVENLHFVGAGWGHAVGMCQIGALGMALKGKSSKEILTHYYPGCTLRRAYK